jgi:hypothetical protein
MRLCVLVLCGFLVTGCGHKLSSDSRVTLRLRLKQGKQFTYDTTIRQVTDLEGKKSSVDTTTSNEYTVLESAEDHVKFKIMVSHAKVTAPEGTQAAAQAEMIEAQLNGISYEASYNDLGEPINVTTLGTGDAKRLAESIASTGAGFQGVDFPDEEVKLGSSWKGHIDLPKELTGGSELALPIIFKVVGMSNEGGHAVVTVDYSINDTYGWKSADGPIQIATTATGQVKLDAETGLPLSNHSEGKNTIKTKRQTIVQQTTSDIKLRE